MPDTDFDNWIEKTTKTDLRYLRLTISILKILCVINVIAILFIAVLFYLNYWSTIDLITYCGFQQDEILDTK